MATKREINRKGTKWPPNPRWPPKTRWLPKKIKNQMIHVLRVFGVKKSDENVNLVKKVNFILKGHLKVILRSFAAMFCV